MDVDEEIDESMAGLAVVEFDEPSGDELDEKFDGEQLVFDG
jgi:hypothetical protein